jgi:DNA-binding ferritin-like protein (Dps family)
VGETEMQQCFQKLQNRMDRIEEATVKSSSLEAKICDEITDFKKEVLKEIKKMGTKPTNHSADQDSFRQQLHEDELLLRLVSTLFHGFPFESYM